MKDEDVPKAPGAWYHPMEDASGEVQIETMMADSVVVRSATIDTPIGILPVVIFDFARSTDQRQFPPITFVGDDATLRNLDRLVNAATTQSLAAAKQKRKERRHGKG